MAEVPVRIVSAITAAAILWRLPQTGMFTFTTAASVETFASAGKLLTLTLIQVMPECPVDFFVTWAEIKAGLISFHEAYLRNQTFEGFVLKLSIMVAGLCFVLAACIET